jgi:thiol-disulfide isomerase/thioredoxin
MKKNFLRSFLLFVIVVSQVNIFAQNRTIRFQKNEWQQILAIAAKEHKMIYLDCQTSWCGPCKWMAQHVFTNDTVADFYNANFINVEMDMEKGEGPGLKQKYGVNSYPTMLYLNSDGSQVHRTAGKANVATFIQNGKDALDPKKQLFAYATEFNNNISNSAIVATYLKMLKDISQPYNNEVNAYFSTQKEADLLSSGNWPIIFNYIANAAGKMSGSSLSVFNYMVSNKESFIRLHGTDSVEKVIDIVYNYELFYAAKDSVKTSFESAKNLYRKTATKRAAQTILYADLHYYQSHEDWKNYALTAIEYIEKYAMNNKYELAADALNFYKHVDDRAQLEKAASWAKTAVDMSNENLNFNEVYALLLYKLDKKEEAKLALERTIELAKKAGSGHADLLKMLNDVNGKKQD